MKKTTKQQERFTMTSKACEGIWFRHFAFTAVDQEEANEKAFKWARYHSFDVREVKAEKPTEDEANWNIHNEYIN